MVSGQLGDIDNEVVDSWWLVVVAVAVCMSKYRVDITAQDCGIILANTPRSKDGLPAIIRARLEGERRLTCREKN